MIEAQLTPMLATPTDPDVTGPSARLSVSVVICAYTERRWDDLRAAIQSVARQSVRPDELIIVVDHNDSLAERTAREFPGVQTVTAEGRPGLSQARNTGVARSCGDIVLFLDDDARADADWVDRTVQAFADPAVIGVGGWALPRWDPPGRPVWFPEPLLWVVGCSYRGLPTVTAPVRNPIGAVMAFRRGAFELVGGFCNGVGRTASRPSGCEETEFSIRLRRAAPDKVILLEPSARVEHRVTRERMSWRYLVRRCWHEGRSKYAVSRLVGPDDALSAERAYVTRVLPAAVLEGLRDAVRTGRPEGLLRAAAVLVGLTATVAGYLAAWAASRRRGRE